MRYDIEADWHLLDTCNYRCAYCFSKEDRLGSKLRRFASNGAWRQAFDATGLTWLLHLTGGEPTIYPDFTDFCARLTERHFISFNSNLSNRCVRTFGQSVDPARVSFINAGLHISERERRSGLATFLDHVSFLKARNFPVFVSIVATPAVLADMDRIIETVRPTGLIPVPKILRNRHNGRRYPQDYSSAERDIFRAWAKRAGGVRKRPFSARPSIDLSGDETVLEGVPSFEGRTCSAGRRFVSVRPNGDVHRCSQTLALGNLLAGSFERALKAERCDTRYCFYFCQKYYSPTFQERVQGVRDKLPEWLVGPMPSPDHLAPGE
jgi:MoaA/NifB/PqqE/SkfB family radical SAM enzyme